MKIVQFGFLVAALFGTAAAQAQNHAMMHGHGMASMPDGRELVDFPPPMRAHTLSNMRDHLQALSGILTALGAGQYGEAANMADARLGLASPSAAGCRPGGGSGQGMSMPSMEQEMNSYMPQGMRDIGLAMHTAASDFAQKARAAQKNGNPTPALAALAKVTSQCAACHDAYRVQ